LDSILIGSTKSSANRAHPIRGYAYIACATFLWGMAATLGRAAFTGRLLPSGEALKIDPLILSQSRTAFSFVILLPVLLVWRGWQPLKVPRADVVRLVLLGVLGVAASNYFYYLAIQKTNVATAIILQYSAPVLVLLYTVARGQQRATLQKFAGVGLAVVGSALAIGVVGAGGFRLNTAGVAAGLLAAVSFAFYNVAGHRLLARYDRWIVLLYTTLSASVFWLFINPPWKLVTAHYSGLLCGFLLLFAVVSVVAPFSCYFAGLQHLEPTRAIVASCLEPVFSILIAAIALSETVRPVQTLGIVVVLAAIVLVQLPDHRGAEVTVVEPIE
jgi:drug/metabolite transporter, DME family